ncbi:Para-nitrobenzyl esterase [Paramyrothecium foliicola]|nr:Para-nitrobenzyl esterase [Paramyrothecium foliicola]
MATVLLPTYSVPSYAQTIVGKQSPISDDVEEFRGIPYGHVPGRWEHSRLRDRLPSDTFDATKNGPRCPVLSKGDTRLFQSYLPFPDDRQDEFDCLNLLIVRPSKAALAMNGIDTELASLPVVVWIHGGGFMDGVASDPTSDPARLVLRSLKKKTPFIAVSINYRLNIFGFGASSDMLVEQSSHDQVKGVNFGLHDQKLALIWVNRNIAAFGGDPNKVTIMGNSAGGISCHMHLLEAEFGTKKPLFRKASLLSGTLGCLDTRSLEKADELWADLCRLRSIKAESPVDRLDALKRIPAEDLLQSIAELHWKLFTLVIDELTIRESNLGCGVSIHLGHDELLNQLKAPDEKIQIMVSMSAEEFYGFVLMANWDYAKFHSLFTSCYPSTAEAEKVLQAYDIVAESPDNKLFDGLVQFISDATMTVNVYRAVEFFNEYRREQSLLRGFDSHHVGVQTFHVEFGNPFLGPMQGIAHHGVELIYAFGNFDDALERADRGIREGYVEPDTKSADAAGPESQSQTRMTESEDEKRRVFGGSNIDLSHKFQDELIRFVVEENHETDRRADVDKVTTYYADRTVRVEDRATNEKWVARKKRREVLGENPDALVTATKRLVGSVLNMSL